METSHANELLLSHEETPNELDRRRETHDETNSDYCILGKSPNDAMDSGIDENLSDKTQDDAQCSENTSDVTTSTDSDDNRAIHTNDGVHHNDMSTESDVVDDADNSDDDEDEDDDVDEYGVYSRFSSHRDSRSHASVGSSASDNMPHSALKATPKVFEEFTEEEPVDEVVRRIRRRASVKPPDGGWGWVVVGGCFIAFFLGGGLSRSFTLIYQHMLVVFGQSAAATSATAALFGSVKMCSSKWYLLYILNTSRIDVHRSRCIANCTPQPVRQNRERLSRTAKLEPMLNEYMHTESDCLSVRILILLTCVLNFACHHEFRLTLRLWRI